MSAAPIVLGDEVADGLASNAPVVALESTVIAHGLPWPENRDTALAMAAAIRAAGAVPAVIALGEGRVRVGLTDDEVEALALSRDALKTSRRDLPWVLACGAEGATTVAATMACARMAGIAVFATGGIGGVHRGAGESADVSADLVELGRTRVAVVASGAKSILDLPRTCEWLETFGVTVCGYGVDTLPAFYVRSSGIALPARVDTPQDAARVIRWNERLDGAGVLIANPIPAGAGLPEQELEGWIAAARACATRDGVSGKAVTPYLLERLHGLSGGRTRDANRALLVDNARVAAEIAMALSTLDEEEA